MLTRPPAARMPRRRPGRAAPRHGLAALTIVMVLFLIMAMVAAYTNRNLIFEQRTSANSYRSERALAAADAGVDWAVSMLNSGRINDQCELDADAATNYRERYITADGEGRLSVRAASVGSTPLYSGCANVDGRLSCACSTADAPTVSVTSSADPPGNAFRINYFVPGGAARSGAIGLSIQGCGTPGLEGANCVSAAADPQVDGRARVVATLGLVRALPSAPSAALTAATSVSAAGVSLRITNEDALTGYTVHTGGTITADAGSSRYVVPAGTGGDGWIDSDSALYDRRLQNLAAGASSADAMFIATFGMDGPNYRRQQGVVRKACDSACDITDLDYMLKLFPGRTLWFDGDLSIDGVTTAASGSIGTAARPAMVIVTGTLSIAQANPMVGFFYGSAVSWGAAGATLRGALVSATSFSATATTTITYDADVIRTLVTSYGTFVRTPGSWNRATF